MLSNVRRAMSELKNELDAQFAEERANAADGNLISAGELKRAAVATRQDVAWIFMLQVAVLLQLRKTATLLLAILAALVAIALRLYGVF